MMHDIMDVLEVKICRDLLFLDTDRLPLMNPWDIRDSERNLDNGYSFVCNNPNYRRIALQQVFGGMHRRGIDIASSTRQIQGRWILVAEARDAYRAAAEGFRELLMLAIAFICGMAGRGTEMLSLLFRNKGAAQRNIYVQLGCIMIITSYHKGQNITGTTKV
jgi:hypothetical protein